MTRVILISSLCLIAAWAYGEQPQTPMETALITKLNQEVNGSLQCLAAHAGLQQQLAAVTKERDELKAKLEPANPEKK